MCFGDVITAMVTPFHEDGSVHYEKAQELAVHLLNNGSDGILVCGTTGENPTLSEEETETSAAAEARRPQRRAPCKDSRDTAGYPF